MNTPRRHHHVWRYYLEAWATGSKVFCLQEGRISTPNPINVAVQRDFYALHILSDADLRFVRLLFRDLPDAGKQALEHLILLFGGIGRIKTMMDILRIDDAAARAFVERQMIATEEDWHGRIEDNILPVVEAIRRKDLRFYDDKARCGDFLHFLSVQYFRTKGLRERSLRASSAHPDLAALEPRFGFSLRRCWNIVSHMFALNSATRLLSERGSRPLVLLENDTGTPFATGDQPVINLFADHGSYATPDLLALYWPVSPRLAVVVDEVAACSGFNPGPVPAEQAQHLNRLIAANAHRQVFGSTREVLLELAGI